MRLSLLSLLTVFLVASCYEDRVGCLDPDAANYDLLADEACPDCCIYPELSIRLTSVWGEENAVAGGSYADVTGDSFQLVSFRFYLGDLQLYSDVNELEAPSRPVDLEEDRNGEVSGLTLNGNYLLGTLTRGTTNQGTVRLGESPLAGLSGTYGLPDRYRNVIPASAPTGDALRTQPRRLNFRDGSGYVQSRLEYTRVPGGDTLSVSSYGSTPFSFDFGEPVSPLRGADLRLDLEADLSLLLGEIDLSADSATIATGLSRTVDFLRPTAITF